MNMPYNNIQTLLSNLKSSGLEKEDILKAVNDIYQDKKENTNDKNDKCE